MSAQKQQKRSEIQHCCPEACPAKPCPISITLRTYPMSALGVITFESQVSKLELRETALVVTSFAEARSAQEAVVNDNVSGVQSSKHEVALAADAAPDHNTTPRWIIPTWEAQVRRGESLRDEPCPQTAASGVSARNATSTTPLPANAQLRVEVANKNGFATQCAGKRSQLQNI